MKTILISAFSWLMKFLFRAGTVKLGVGSFLFFGISGLLSLLLSLLPSWLSADGLSGLFGSFTPGLWYLWDYAQLSFALSIVFGAYTARFLIRRIPFFG